MYFNNVVRAVAKQPDGKILIGGDFTQYLGQNYNRIIRLNNNLTIDTTFNIGNGFNNSVNSIFIESNNNILVGGNFNTYNNTPLVNNFARLGPNGQLVSTSSSSSSFVSSSSSSSSSSFSSSSSSSSSSLNLIGANAYYYSNTPITCNTGSIEMISFTNDCYSSGFPVGCRFYGSNAINPEPPPNGYYQWYIGPANLNKIYQVVNGVIINKFDCGGGEPSSSSSSSSSSTTTSIDPWVFKEKILGNTIDDNPFYEGGFLGHDEWGSSVATNSDGTVVILGGPDDDTQGDKVGGALIFTGNKTAGWSLKQKILGKNNGSRYGTSVATNSDGTVIMMGGHIDGTRGGVRVYVGDKNNGWSLKQDLGYPVDEATAFGFAFFGRSVAINNEGTILAVGAPEGATRPTVNEDLRAGVVKIYTGNKNIGWVEKQTLYPNSATNSSRAGWSVSMNHDGSIIGFGAWGDTSVEHDTASAAFIFTGNANNGWGFKQKLLSDTAGDKFGHSVKFSKNGNIFVVGSQTDSESSFSAGAVTIFNGDPNNGWTFRQKITESPTFYFGDSVSTNFDGSVISVAATNYGQFGNTPTSFIYQGNANNGWSYVQRMERSYGSYISPLTFGINAGGIDMTDDGLVVFVGNSKDDTVNTDVGATNVYVNSTIPSNFRVSGVTSRSAFLVWDRVNNASSYSMDVSTNSSFTDLVVNNRSFSTFSGYVTGLDIDSSYYARVRSVFPTFTSLNSSPLSFRTFLNRGEPITGFAAPFFAPVSPAIGGGFITALDTDSQGNVYIGGYFNAVNGQEFLNLVKLFPDGEIDLSFGRFGTNGQIESMIYDDTINKLYVVGRFFMVDGVLRPGIARLNPNGTIDHTFKPPDLAPGSPSTTTTSMILSLALQPDGKIFVGGNFTYGRAVYRNIIRLNTDGSVDSTFSPYAPVNGTIVDIKLQGDKILLAGGSWGGWTNFGRLLPDGSVDTTFWKSTTSLQGGFTGPVNTIAPTFDNFIYVGGGFTSYGSSSFYRSLIKLGENGQPVYPHTTIGYQPGINGEVNKIFIDNDHTSVIIGGNFSQYGSAALNIRTEDVKNIVTITPQGFIDNTFYPFHVPSLTRGTNNPVNTISKNKANDSVFIGGSFTTFNGEMANRVALIKNNYELTKPLVNNPTSAPSTPTGLKAWGVEAGRIFIKWSPVANAKSYLVDYSTSSNFAQNSSFLNNQAFNNSFSLSSLNSNQLYYIRVRAVNRAGNSSYSTVLTVGTLPVTPSNTPSFNFGNGWYPNDGDFIDTTQVSVSIILPVGVQTIKLDVSSDNFYKEYLPGFKNFLVTSNGTNTSCSTSSCTIYINIPKSLFEPGKRYYTRYKVVGQYGDSFHSASRESIFVDPYAPDPGINRQPYNLLWLDIASYSPSDCCLPTIPVKLENPPAVKTIYGPVGGLYSGAYVYNSPTSVTEVSLDQGYYIDTGDGTVASRKIYYITVGYGIWRPFNAYIVKQMGTCPFNLI